MENIYNYIDYREYLKAFMSNKKIDLEDKYSYRIMSSDFGFTSPNFFKLVIDGDRNIGKESLGKVSQKLFSKKKERDYFELLVKYSSAKSLKAKTEYIEQILEITARRNTNTLLPEQYQYFTDWYNPIMREILKGRNVNDLDFALIATSLTPQILPKEVKKSFELLCKLKILKVDQNGVITQQLPILKTGNDSIKSVALATYHKSLLEIASESIDNFDSSNREISAITAKVSKKGLDKIKKRLQSINEELLEIIAQDSETDRICQVNLQMFPVYHFNKKGDCRE